MSPHTLSGVHAIPTLLLVASLGAVAPLIAEPTEIYGPKGEKWQAAGGPLPDFSYAGYQRGEKPLPTRTPDVSVKDSGAVGDGKADDTAAIQKAIDDNPGKTILLPAGRYKISKVIVIQKSGTVLQGEGPDKTIIVPSVSLQEIDPLPISYPDTGGTAYAYSGAFINVAGSSTYYTRDYHAVTEPAVRGDTKLQLAPGHPIKAGDEIVVIASDTSGQSLLKHLYRDDPSDVSKAGESYEFRHVSRVKAVEGTALTLERPLRTDLREEWKPGVRIFRPQVEEVGIEHLAFEFPESPYEGHFTEKGLNAIQMTGVCHSWVRNVTIRNADSGIFVRASVFCTLTGIVVESERRVANRYGVAGHHGLSLTSLDCLCTDFQFKTTFIHDLTVSNGSVGNVFSNGRAPDMSLDHHKRAPYENLFSNLDLGKGERMFVSGGSVSIGRHAAAGNTYWNLVSRSSVEMPEGFGPSRLNFIGVKMRGRGKPDAKGQWVESITPGKVEPPDLHAAQLARRVGGGTEKPPGESPVHDWVNAEGQTVKARFAGLKGSEVLLVLQDGQTVNYPLAKLSAASQALARKLAGS